MYVDDLLITGDDLGIIIDIKAMLSTRYKMKDLGLAQKYLGVTFQHTPDGLLLHQVDYCSYVFHKSGMEDSRHESTPLPPGLVLTSQMGTTPFDLHQYSHVVGS